MELFLLIPILLIPYAIAGLVIMFFSKRRRYKKDYSLTKSVSIFLPTYNEEKNIAKKLDNLLSQSYPVKEILIFDCSTDGTRKIVEKYARQHPCIKLIRQSGRIGMARTLNEAFSTATGDIFVKTDCDSLSSTNALKELIANFADSSVGGATGICVADRSVEKYFRKFMTRIQLAETNIDSTLIAHATSLLAFRKELVEPVKPDSLADDTEEFLLIRKKGYRTILDPDVISKEQVPSDYLIRRMQKDRRAQGIIRVLMENITMSLNPRYGKYGCIVLPLEWFILVFSPMIFIALGVAAGITLYNVNPLFTIAGIIGLAALLIRRSNIVSAIIDTELSGFVGLIKNLIQGKQNGIWVKAQEPRNVGVIE
jgi:cellulose synthase/poly-beta-1,6-N-acetylglucosamine synthase-like glycosyltransferase